MICHLLVSLLAGFVQSNACDDFDRGTTAELGPAWAEASGDLDIVTDACVARSGFALATRTDSIATADQAIAAIDFRATATDISYAALVLGYASLSECLFVKVQDDDADGLMDRVYFYWGNNGSPWNPAEGSFALANPTPSGRLSVRIDLATDAVIAEIDNHSSGQLESFASHGVRALAGQVGTQVGMGGFGSVELDNWILNAGCGGGLQLSVTQGAPGQLMAFEASGVGPSELVGFVYARGLGSYRIDTASLCGGTTLLLDQPIGVEFAAADASGVATFSRQVPPGAAGAVYVQAVAVSSCDTSGAIQL